MQIFLFIMLLLVQFCTICADPNRENEAELYVRSALYKKAAECYENLLKGSKDPSKNQIYRQQLAFCLYSQESFASVLSLLGDSVSLTDPEKLYLGSAYNHLGRFQDAIKTLTPSQDPKIDSEIGLERGIAYYGNKQYNEADAAFSKAASSPLAQIYRVKVALDQNNFDGARQILDAGSIPKDHPLIYEWYFLQGIIALQMEKRQLALEFFEKTLVSDKAPWVYSASMHLGKIYLAQAEDTDLSLDLRRDYFNKAIQTLSKATEIRKTDEALLALGSAYISKGRNLGDNEALTSAIVLLRDGNLFSGREAQNKALFLSAQAANNFEERDSLFRRLTQEMNSGSPDFGSWWLHRGINNLNESQHAPLSMREVFVERALNDFKQAESLLTNKQLTEASTWRGRAHLLQNSHAGYQKAKAIFAQLLKKPETLDEPSELYYLYAQALLKSQETELHDIEWLKEGLKSYPSNEGLFLLGIIHYKKEEWEEAQALFEKVVEGNNHDLRGEALFWAGKSALADSRKEKATQCLTRLYQEYPQHKYAPEAYFSLYSYKEYMQGNKQAMKHLQQLPVHFPHSPYILNAYYLMGLDLKRERKSHDGKKVHPRDLNGAIQAFHQVEEQYEDFLGKGLIPSELLEHATRLYYYAALERALANLKIADQSEGAKQDIFLEYAQGLLEKMALKLKNSSLTRKESYPAIEEETHYWLANVYLKAQNREKAVEVLNEMLNRFSAAKITRGYYLSRVWLELGSLSLQQKDYKAAIVSLEKADETGKGGVLSTDGLLNIWILKSDCYRGMADYDNAIRILTQVTNENVISGLRLKAMFLRSELYALQNRPELERNQLKALAKKGGEWALKARQTLETKYGY